MLKQCNKTHGKYNLTSTTILIDPLFNPIAFNPFTGLIWEFAVFGYFIYSMSIVLGESDKFLTGYFLLCTAHLSPLSKWERFEVEIKIVIIDPYQLIGTSFERSW